MVGEKPDMLWCLEFGSLSHKTLFYWRNEYNDWSELSPQHYHWYAATHSISRGLYSQQSIIYLTCTMQYNVRIVTNMPLIRYLICIINIRYYYHCVAGDAPSLLWALVHFYRNDVTHRRLSDRRLTQVITRVIIIYNIYDYNLFIYIHMLFL